MRNFAAILILVFLLQSCNSILFDTAQPKGNPVLKQIPDRLTGTFISEELGDTLIVESTSFVLGDGEPIQISGDFTPRDCALKKMNDWYIISIEEEGEWEVFPVKVWDDDRFTVYYMDLEESREKEIIEELQKSVKVQKKYSGDGSFDHYLVDPDKNEFKKLLKKKVFSEEMTFTRIK